MGMKNSKWRYAWGEEDPDRSGTLIRSNDGPLGSIHVYGKPKQGGSAVLIPGPIRPRGYSGIVFDSGS